MKSVELDHKSEVAEVPKTNKKMRVKEAVYNVRAYLAMLGYAAKSLERKNVSKYMRLRVREAMISFKIFRTHSQIINSKLTGEIFKSFAARGVLSNIDSLNGEILQMSIKKKNLKGFKRKSLDRKMLKLRRKRDELNSQQVLLKALGQVTNINTTKLKEKEKGLHREHNVVFGEKYLVSLEVQLKMLGLLLKQLNNEVTESYEKQKLLETSEERKNAKKRIKYKISHTIKPIKQVRKDIKKEINRVKGELQNLSDIA